MQKEPFIRLGNDNAPTLNYNIPQSASFNTYGVQFIGRIEVNNKNVFVPRVRETPPNNFFAQIEGKNISELTKIFTEELQMASLTQASSLVASGHLLEKHLRAGNDAWNLQNVRNAGQAEIMGMSTGFSVVEQQTPEAVSNVNKELSTISDEIVVQLPPRPPVPPQPFRDTLAAQFAERAYKGQQPHVSEGLGRLSTNVTFFENPQGAAPQFAIIEEYTTSSFLGDYGAGQTLKTFSLLPGEKTTLRIRTYKEISSTQSRSENVLDSFSDTSTQELQNLIEAETKYSDSSEVKNGRVVSNQMGASVSVSPGGAVGRLLGLGASASANRETTTSSSTTATRSSNARALNKALDKHVSSSNSHRAVDVNTTTDDTRRESEEKCVVRELENINKSRVLNFVFRQLLQQYVTITYLSNIKIAFTNGYQEVLQIVDVDELDRLLEDTVEPAHRAATKERLLRDYHKVLNYKDDEIPFLGERKLPGTNESFWRVRKDVESRDTWYSNPDNKDEGLRISVDGPILHVNTHTLRTESVVVDALLGQGEALDSFNLRAQDAKAISEKLNNLEQLQQIRIIQGITDPIQRAEMYRNVFGTVPPCSEHTRTII